MKKPVKPLVSAAALMLGGLCGGFAAAQTVISANTTTTSGPAVTATAPLTVNAGITLTVTSGNAVKVQSGPAEIDNYGTIAATAAAARAIRDTQGTGYLTTIQNYPGALISAAANDAIELGNNDPGNGGTLYNQGTVQAQGSSDQAVNFNHVTAADSVVYNFASGVIASQQADAVRPGAGDGGSTAAVYNAGIICISSAAGDASSSDAIDLQSNSGVAVYNGPFSAFAGAPADTTVAAATVPTICPATVTGPQVIQGERHGITGGNTNDGLGATPSTDGTFVLDVTNSAGYTIQGDNGAGLNIDGFGVNASGVYTGDATQDTASNELVTVVNDGTITGNGVTGDGDGVDVDGLVNLTNSGTIVSLHAYNETSEGVTVGGGAITNNAGALIEGDNSATNADSSANSGTGRGITLAGIDHEANTNAVIAPPEGIYADTVIDNSGTIRGQSDAGIAVTGAGNAHTVTVNNQTCDALIEGAGAGYAAVFTGANDATVINRGTITEDASGIAAIELGSGDSSVQILGGCAAVNGNINGGSGASALQIAPGSGNSFKYAGVISNFASAEIGAGTTVLTGASTSTGATTIDAGGALQVDGSIAAPLTVNGTLQGKGTASGAVEVANGGVVHPGDAAGDTATLKIGALTLDAGSTANLDLGGSAGSSDQIQVAGALTIASGAKLVVTLPATPVAGSYTLFSAASVTGDFGTTVVTYSRALPASLSASVVSSSGNVQLVIASTGLSDVAPAGVPALAPGLSGVLALLLAWAGFAGLRRRAMR